MQFSALISVTCIKKVLCANSCVKFNQVGVNLAKTESVEEKLFKSDRESILIFIHSRFMLSSNYEGEKATNKKKNKQQKNHNQKNPSQ